MAAGAPGSLGQLTAKLSLEAGSSTREGGSKIPHDAVVPREGESDEDFFARKDEEARVEFAAAVQEWREDKAKGGGQAKILEARGGFSRSSEDGDAGSASAGQECTKP